MNKLTATVLLLTALSAPALAESPAQRQLHSWDYVQQVSNPAAATTAPVVEHPQHSYMHHDKAAKGKGKGKHAHKKHAEGAKKPHHHHKKGAAHTKAAPAKEEPKQ